MNNRCDDFLKEYGTGTPRHGQAGLDRHADGCGACDQARTVLRVVSQHVLEDEPSSFARLEEHAHEAVLARLRAPAEHKAISMTRRLMIAASFTAAVIGLLSGFFMKLSSVPAKVCRIDTLLESGRFHREQPIIIEFAPVEGNENGESNRVKFVVKGFGATVEQGELELDEPILDTVNHLAMPASINGL
ncbi:hypothetical protein ACFLU6_07535 [Acidobacteriota bacterium]